MRRPSERPHVLTITDTIRFGGAERLAFELPLRTDSARFRRTLCVTRDLERADVRVRADARLKALEAADVAVLQLARKSRFSLSRWVRLAQFLRSERVDVIHAHMFGSNVWGTVVGRLSGVPVILAHEHTWSFEGQALRRWASREIVGRFADAVIAVSEADRRRMIEVVGIPAERIVFIPNGIPSLPGGVGSRVRHELDIPETAPVLVAVANLRPQKALHVMIRALAVLNRSLPETRLILAGDGDQSPLRALAAELGVADRVMFLGARRDVADVLAAADIAVSSSDFEGSPLSVMEYMAAGLPVVGTAVGGMPQLVQHGRTGLLVPRRDPGALAAALGELLSDPVRAKEMGKRGREHQRQEFSLEAMVGRVEELYDTQLARKGESAPARRRALHSDARPEFELESFTTLEAARDVWPTLAERSQNLFATWEWISTWWRHFGSGRPLVGSIAVRPGGEPAVILPLYIAMRKPLLVLRFLGHGPSDWLGPIHAPADAEIAAAALQETLDGTRGLDVLLAENVLAASGWNSELGGTVLRREGFPILRFGGRTWEGLLGERSSNFREQVQRKERRLARAHKLTYRLSDDPDRLDADLDLLFRLHDARWKSAASGALASTRQAFHRDFARLAQARGWLRLWILELDGEPAAAWYGFRYAGVEWYYQAGRDPVHDADSVGFVLLCHTIRAALEDGAEAYWFLRGDEPFKRRFAEEDPGLETLAVARSLRGRAAVASLAYVDRLPAVPKRWKRVLAR